MKPLPLVLNTVLSSAALLGGCVSMGDYQATQLILELRGDGDLRSALLQMVDEGYLGGCSTWQSPNGVAGTASLHSRRARTVVVSRVDNLGYVFKLDLPSRPRPQEWTDWTEPAYVVASPRPAWQVLSNIRAGRHAGERSSGASSLSLRYKVIPWHEPQTQRQVIEGVPQEVVVLRALYGQTLQQLADEHEISIGSLRKANGLDENALIREGDLVRVPWREPKEVVDRRQIITVRGTRYAAIQHEMTKGDTLGLLSDLYAVPLQDLQSANQLLPDSPEPAMGTKVWIPVAPVRGKN